MAEVAGNVHNTKCGDGGGMDKNQACGSRISFAPGTTFHDRTRVRSRGPSQKVPATFNFRPTTPREKPQTPKLRFKLPKATLPSLHYLSVSQEDFLDPRYAQDIVKTYGIPKYFFKSKSNLLSSAGKSRSVAVDLSGDGGGGSGGGGGGDVVQTRLGAPSEDDKQKQSVTIGKEVIDDARPKTSGEKSAFPTRFARRFQVVSVAQGSSEQRSESARFHAGESGARNEGSEADSKASMVRTVAPVYRPLIGEKYTHARFLAPMNPYRSLQLESELTKYVEHKKRVGLGRYVEFVDTDSVPSSALMREASMYDLNHDGPAERPLDGFLPPPDRKPFIRQRPRDPKNDFVRSADDRDLVIMPRERSSMAEKNGNVLKDGTGRDVQIPTDQVGCRLTTYAVSIPTHRGKRTNLVNVYYPNGSNSEADVEWLYNLGTNQNSWVVAGDFNVSHKLWDTGQTKDSGDHLANTILNSRLVVLNDGSFTQIGQPGQRSSAIDLTLTSPDLSLDAEWTIGTDHLQSDHLPLHLVLHKADPTPAEIDTSPKFLYHKADWELLALKLTSECENHDPRDPDINTHYENIRSMILRAAEATIPKKSPGTNGPHQHSAAWWNEECAKSTRAKRRALRHFQKKPV
ncbi:hypothetical protein ACOMHN_009478 [Nucella lapillus]